MKTNSVPKIRFKGFTDDWEQRKLGDFGKATGGTSIESEFSEDGLYKVISIGSYSENGVYNDQGIRAIKSDKTSNRVLNRNDLTMILNDKTTSGNIIGRVLLIEESGIYVYNQRTERIEINLDEYDPVFLYEMLNAPNIREKIIKQAQGNTQIYVNWIAISLLEYMIPSKEEQVKIGECLHSISNLITLHQRKCEQTKELKKFMLQKMFPKKGEKNPEIRFSGFTDDWEQRKLESLCEVFTDGDWIEAKDQSNSGVRLIQTGNIGITEYLDKENNKKWISEETLKRLRCEEVYPGDILISRLPDPAGRACILPNLGIRMITAVDCTIIRTSKEYDSKYLVQYLSTPTYFKIVNSFLGGGTRQRISRKNLSKIDIPVPHIFAEQQKIGEFFSNLDHLITLHQRECEQLKELKKFMLQNMFPKKG